jgi:hypothetical protein
MPTCMSLSYVSPNEGASMYRRNVLQLGHTDVPCMCGWQQQHCRRVQLLLPRWLRHLWHWRLARLHWYAALCGGAFCYLSIRLIGPVALLGCTAGTASGSGGPCLRTS